MKLNKIGKFWAKLASFTAYTGWLMGLYASPEKSLALSLIGMMAITFFCLGVLPEDE
jgi:hypothetical protein